MVIAPWRGQEAVSGGHSPNEAVRDWVTRAMNRRRSIVLVVILGAILVAAGIFVWPMQSAMAGPNGGLIPAIVMIVGCFAIGGVLMFLVFYSARRGHDEQVYRAERRRIDRR